tara:strand:+ start:317 stop:430 length:114 start_codon:yes stop_codon:yes gene_type:complete
VVLTIAGIVFILVWIGIIYEFKKAPFLDGNYNLIKEL